MAYCADTNVLLRWAEPGTAGSDAARNAVKSLHASGETVYITPQNLVEFWCVATRPTEVNGLGLTSEQAAAEMADLEQLFPLLPDTAAIHAEWRKIVVETGTTGLRTHDARIAAALLVHGVSHILTFNVRDFAGFSHIVAVNPADVPPATPS
jgi:predicted nucleic acid-binding protein